MSASPDAARTRAKGLSRFDVLESFVEPTARASPFLTAEEVAERLRCSLRSIHELVRTRRIPHRRLPGSRRCLFRTDELEVWENGAPLEVIESPGGGRVVRPRLERR